MSRFTVLRLVVYPVRSYRIVWIKFGSFPGAIEGIHFELQRPKYFVNVYIVLYRVAGFPPGPKNFISMFSLWAAVGGVRWGNGVESKRKD